MTFFWVVTQRRMSLYRDFGARCCLRLYTFCCRSILGMGGAGTAGFTSFRPYWYTAQYRHSNGVTSVGLAKETKWPETSVCQNRNAKFCRSKTYASQAPANYIKSPLELISLNLFPLGPRQHQGEGTEICRNVRKHLQVVITGFRRGDQETFAVLGFYGL
jgi:hypothetical protein